MGKLSIFAAVDIEVREIRKFFLALGDRHIECDGSRGKPILALFADRTNMMSTEESDPIVLAPVERAIAGFLDAQTGEARA